MSKKSSTYCFCESARFSGGYLATPTADVMEISLKFEKTHAHDDKDDANSIPNNSNTEKCNLNFLELSHKTMSDVCSNAGVHHCVSDLLQHILTNKALSEQPINTSIQDDETPSVEKTANVTVHQESEDDSRHELKIAKRNSSLRSSMKSSHSMETILEKNSVRKSFIDKSPDESKAKSVSHLNDDEDEEYEYIENGESIELIFISDEFVNKVQKQEQEVIVLDEQNGKRRESLTNNKKIVIITDEYKNKVLRNNSIVVATKEKKLKKKLKKAKTYSTRCEDEDFSIMEDKKIDKESHLIK